MFSFLLEFRRINKKLKGVGSRRGGGEGGGYNDQRMKSEKDESTKPRLVIFSLLYGIRLLMDPQAPLFHPSVFNISNGLEEESGRG